MRLVGNAFSVTLVGLIVLGAFSNFLVNENVISYFIWSGVAVSAMVMAAILKDIMTDGSKFRENIDKQGISPVIGVIAIVFTVFLMVVSAFYKGLPVALNYLSAESGTLIVTVGRKPAGFYSKWCSGGVYVKEFESFTNDQVCGIKENDWKSIKAGDRIELVGAGSAFGFDYGSYKRLQRM